MTLGVQSMRIKYRALISSIALMGMYSRAEEFPFFQELEHSISTQGESDEPDSGNWYEKLQWWKKAKPAYDTIQGRIAQLKSLAQAFIERKDALKKEIDTFYTTMRIRQKETQEAIEQALDELKTQQEALEAEEISESQQARRVENADKQKKLEELKNELTLLGSLDLHIGESSSVLTEQVKKAERYEERALESFEKMESVLDDKKAKQLYDTIENSSDNIQALIGYVEGSLRGYLEQSAARVMQLMPRIKNMIEELERQGIRVRYLTEEEKKKEEELKKKKLAEEEARIRLAKEKKAKEEEQKNMSWWRWLLNSIASALSSFWITITQFFSSFWQKSTTPTNAPASAQVSKKETAKTTT